MSLTRYSGTWQPFASAENANERTVFGGATQSDLINDNLTSEYLRGWGIVGATEFPTLQDFNALGYTLSYGIGYLYQQGIPEYSSNQTYTPTSVVVNPINNGIYQLQGGTAGDINTWKRVTVESDGTGATGTWDIDISGNSATSSEAVKLTTPRTINGTAFDGTTNITTLSWGTSRTLTFDGDTSGSVAIDGSANATISLTVPALANKVDKTSNQALANGTALTITGDLVELTKGDGTKDSFNLPAIPPPSGVGEIGTYALAINMSQTILAPGDTVAGADLQYASTVTGSNVGYGGVSLPGTWMCMGQTGKFDGTGTNTALTYMGSVFVRIA